MTTTIDPQVYGELVREAKPRLGSEHEVSDAAATIR